MPHAQRPRIHSRKRANIWKDNIIQQNYSRVGFCTRHNVVVYSPALARSLSFRTNWVDAMVIRCVRAFVHSCHSFLYANSLRTHLNFVCLLLRLRLRLHRRRHREELYIRVRWGDVFASILCTARKPTPENVTHATTIVHEMTDQRPAMASPLPPNNRHSKMVFKLLHNERDLAFAHEHIHTHTWRNHIRGSTLFVCRFGRFGILFKVVFV